MAWHLLVVAGIRLAVSGMVLASGITAVNDDDYHRLVIALGFAELPSASVMGTSWLPFPFVMYGGLFSLLGPSLAAAQAFGVLSGLVSTLAIWDAARRLGGSPAQATLSAVLLTVVPQVAVHGAVTGPELPSHAVSFWAVSVFFNRAASPTTKLVACFGAMLATLSRYEVWPIALVLAYYTLRRGAWWERIVGPLVCGSGIALWLAYWYATTGHPLGFSLEVADYRVALGQAGEPLLWKIARFPALAVASAPELTLVMLVAVWMQRVPDVRAAIRNLVVHLAPSTIALLLFLILSDVQNTMATHHLERPLLYGFMLRGCVAGFACASLIGSVTLQRKFALRALLATVAGLIARPLVPHYTWYHPRPEELRAGAWLREAIEPPMRIAIETSGYGHFAVIAGMGEPRRAALLFDEDPRLRQQELADDVWLTEAKARTTLTNVQWLLVPKQREAALRGWATVRHRTEHYVAAEIQ